MKADISSRLVGLVMLGASVVSCRSPAKQQDASSTFDLSEAASAFFEALRPARIRTLAEAEFRRVPVAVGSNLFSFQFADAARLTGAFKASVRTQDPGVYLRTDTWRLGTDLLPGSLIQAASGQVLPVNIGLTAAREITWSRPFDDKVEALRAVPRTPVDLPLSAEKALRLESGEFVSLPVRMGMSLGVAKGSKTPNLTLQASAGVFWTGEFRINVTRLTGPFVRVKIAPNDVRGSFLAFDANAELNLFGYGPFGLVDLDREAERGLGLDVLKLAARRVGGETMVVDYVIDLSDRYGAAAYDGLLNRTLSLKARAIADAGINGMSELALGDLTLAEALHERDLNEPPERRRVARVFRGSRAFSEDSVSTRLGTKLLRASDQKSLSTSRMNLVSPRNHELSWTYLTFNAQRSLSAMIASQRRSYSTAATAFIDDADRIQSLLFAWNSSERLATSNDKAAIAWASYAILGRTYGQLGLNEALPDAPADKLRVRLDVSFGRDYFEVLEGLAESDPEDYEKRLWTAVYVISGRFKKRQGPRTPAPSASLAGEMRRMMQSSMLSVRTFARNVVNTQWEGINGTTATALIDSLLDLGRRPSAEVFAKFLRVIYRDESAQEIAPALLLALAELNRAEAWTSVLVEAGGREIHRADLGENVHQAEQEFAAAAFQRMNQLGYER